MPKRSKSSARWLAEHANDEFVKRAQREGWRSRAVFKLEEIQQRERLLRPGIRCVDLGAAPGSWSQYAARIVGGSSRIVATDILPMDAIPGVEFVQGDFREAAVLDEVLRRVGDSQSRPCFVRYGPQHGWNRCRGPAAIDVSGGAGVRICRPRAGTRRGFLVKLFQGEGFDQIIRDARLRYGRVVTKKPKASRTRSPEIYLLARQFGMV
jgi:23S rRNA (uridine2552-2'-O)-methyltransferase